MQAKKMAAGRGEMFIWSKLAQNLSEMDVRAFARIKKVIWDQLVATEAKINSPSAENRKFEFMAHLRGTAETCLILIFDY